VLPRSEWIHKFHNIYDMLRPQGWRIHYTNAAAETNMAARGLCSLVRISDITDSNLGLDIAIYEGRATNKLQAI